jgi:hypothetical protein
MTSDLSTAEFEARFTDNVRLFEQLAGQLVSRVIDAHANDPDAAAFEQIRRWQTEPMIAGLIAVYRRESRRSPTSEGWMALASRELAEVVR